MKETFSRALGALDRARNELSCRVEASAVGAKDAVINRTNQITGTVAKTYYGVKGTVSWMVDVGIVVAAIAAPVPTAIGIDSCGCLRTRSKLSPPISMNLTETGSKSGSFCALSLLKNTARFQRAHHSRRSLSRCGSTAERAPLMARSFPASSRVDSCAPSRNRTWSTLSNILRIPTPNRSWRDTFLCAAQMQPILEVAAMTDIRLRTQKTWSSLPL